MTDEKNRPRKTFVSARYSFEEGTVLISPMVGSYKYSVIIFASGKPIARGTSSYLPTVTRSYSLLKNAIIAEQTKLRKK